MQALKYFVVAVFCFAGASAQNCGITGATNTTILMNAVNELTKGDFLIWSEETYNVQSAAAISSPQTKYLQGLRYPSKYEYLTAAIFPEFVQTERSNQLERNVVFTCNDGKTLTYTFLLPVIDENTEPPFFERGNYTATVSQSSNSTEPASANIVVSDGDYELNNANIVVRSSNALVTPFVDPVWSGTHPNPYVYTVDFFVSKSLTPGVYQIILTADDGKFSDFTSLTINVTA